MATISGEGAMRAALAALRSNGGSEVILRLGGLAASGSDAEQMGLATPQFQDVPMGPAVWRKAGVASSLLLPAEEVERVTNLQGFASAKELFQSTAGVVVEGVLYAITSSEPYMVANTSCAYRLTVTEPTWA